MCVYLTFIYGAQLTLITYNQQRGRQGVANAAPPKTHKKKSNRQTNATLRASHGNRIFCLILLKQTKRLPIKRGHRSISVFVRNGVTRNNNWRKASQTWVTFRTEDDIFDFIFFTGTKSQAMPIAPFQTCLYHQTTFLKKMNKTGWSNLFRSVSCKNGSNSTSSLSSAL